MKAEVFTRFKSTVILSLFFFILFQPSLFSEENEIKKEVYISTYQFQQFADFIFDFNVNLAETFYKNLDFDPQNVFEGSIIFVALRKMDQFFKHYHPKIKNRYILITNHGDEPSPDKFIKYLNDPKIIAWLGRNPTIQNHNKFIPIPIGSINADAINELINLPINKEYLLYLNITITTYRKERQHVHDLLYKKKFAYSCGRKLPAEYLMDLKRSKFVASPRGMGLDCWRTWETILMGSIPIVKSSHLDPIFEGLPVLIIQDWSVITEDFLNNKYEEMSKKTYSLDKLYVFYWKNLINNLLKNSQIERTIE